MEIVTLARAWHVAHRGNQALIAGAVIAVLFAAFGATSISLWGSVKQIPLWAFTPGTLVMVVGTTLDGRLDGWLRVAEAPGRIARALWFLAVLGAATLLAVPTAVVLDNQVVVTTTAVLLIASFGPGLVDVRMVTVVGGVVDVGTLMLTRRLEADNSFGLFLETMPAWIWQTMLLVGAIGVAAYVWRGPRKLGTPALPG